MILGLDKLFSLVERNKLVRGLCEREMERPEGAGFDFRLDRVYKIVEQQNGEPVRAFLGINGRNTPPTELLAEFDPASERDKSKRKIFTFEPMKYYLVSTVEPFDMPANLVALPEHRTTVFRSCTTIFTSFVSPGYEGELTFGMINLGPIPFDVELGARIVHCIFMEVKGETRLYRGQNQGGRVTSGGKQETQI